jgi:hypothetical protein
MASLKLEEIDIDGQPFPLIKCLNTGSDEQRPVLDRA